MIMENKNENKKSKLCFDAKIVRRLLKMNGEIRYCPYCGKSIEEGCKCHKNIIVDIKPYRNEDNMFDKDRSVFAFLNNESFKEDFTHIMDDIKSKKEPEYEQITFDEVM